MIPMSHESHLKSTPLPDREADPTSITLSKADILFISQGLCEGVRGLVLQLHLTDVMQCYANLVQLLLAELEQREDANIVSIEANNCTIVFHENNGHLFISIDDMDRDFENTSLHHVEIQMLNDILYFQKYFSPELIDKALLRIITLDGVRGDMVYDAVENVFLNPKLNPSEELKSAAMQDLFKFKNSYRESLFEYAIPYIIQRSPNCLNKSTAEAAKYIIDNINAFNFASVSCACTFIVSRNAPFDLSSKKRALQHIKTHQEKYPAGVLKSAAFEFININKSFFDTPQVNQDEFIAFFKKYNALHSLQEYSNRLAHVLRENDKLYVIPHPKSEDKRTLSILSLWTLGEYNSALRLNSNIATFILNNMEHTVITLWNSIANAKRVTLT